MSPRRRKRIVASRRFQRALRLEQLEGRWLMATDLDDSLSEATVLSTNPLSPGVPLSASESVSPDTDVDMYRFRVTAGQVVDFDIDTPLNGPGGVGTYLRLFDFNGQQLATNNDGAAPGENTVGYDAYLRYTFAASGTYFIGVSNANNIQYDPTNGNGDTAGGQNSTGIYTLTVEALPLETDDTESKAIVLGGISATPITHSETIATDIDVDMYRFTVLANRSVDFDIDTPTNGPGGLGSYIRLFDSSGQQLAFNNDGVAPGENVQGFDSFLRFTFTTGGTYYLGVSNANNSQYDPITGGGDTAGGENSIGDYTLTVQLTPPVVNDLDDSLSEATLIGTISTTAITQSADISPDTDVDMYRFTVTAGLVVDFDVDTAQNGSGGLGSYLRLFNAQGTELAANNDANAPGENTVGFDAYLRFTFATAGTYYIGVSNANNIQYSPTTGSGDTSGGANATGTYQLTVQALAADTDDTLSTAFSLGPISTTAVTANSTISTDIDVDIYRFTVTARQIVDFDIDTSTNGPPGLGSYLRLFNSQGQELASNNDASAPGESTTGFDAYLRFTFTTSGTYYIGVSNSNNIQYSPTTGTGDTAGGLYSTGAYQLMVGTAPPAQSDPDDTLAESTGLGTISPTQVISVDTPDSIASDTDVDLYSFSVAAGQIVDFDILTQLNGPGGLDSYLRLFDAQGQQLAFNDNAPGSNEAETVDGFDAYLRYQFATAGTYYIGVSNASNTQYDPVTGNGDAAGGPNATGTYHLTVHIPFEDMNDSLNNPIPAGTLSTAVVTKNGSISPDVDVDMYSFTVAAGQTVDFDIDTSKNGPGGLNSLLRLFDAQGLQLAFNDDATAPGDTTAGFDAYLHFTFATAGTYYLGVSNANNTGYDPVSGNGDTAGGSDSIGTYRLSFQVVPASPTDPNDTLAEATPLGTLSTTPTTVAASISPDTDVNIYRFSVVANQTVDFDIDTTQNGGSGLNSYLRLFNSQGTQLSFVDNAAAPGEAVGFDAYLRFTFASGGTYYIAVSNANNTLYDPVSGNNDTAGGENTVGSYQLVVQTIVPDPDDSLAEAQLLGAISTTPVTKTDSISPDTDVDMYRFTAAANQTVDFDIDTALNGTGGLGSYIRLFNDRGEELARNDNGVAPGENKLGFDAYLRYTFAVAGTYFLGVSNSTNIQYDANSGEGDIAGGPDATGAYSLTVQALPADTDDSLSEAPLLGTLSTTAIVKNDAISTDIDVDLLRFTVAAGQVVDFDIDTTQNGSGGVDSFLRLFNSQGQAIASNNNAAAPGESTVGFDAYLRYTFMAAGTYYVGVSNANNTLYDPITGNNDTAGGFNTVGLYQLSAVLVPVVVPDSDDSIAEAIAIGAVSTTPVTKSDSISPDTDVDLYAIQVTAGQAVDFDLDTPTNAPGGLGSYLRLFNAAGQQLAANDNGAAPGETLGLDSYLRYIFSTAGTYYIGVSNSNNTQYDPSTGNGDTAGGPNSVGSYQLIVQAVPAALSLSINIPSMPQKDGTAQATISRSGADLSQPVVVTLSSSNTAAATVPSSVTIPVNQSSAAFTITAVDDHVADGTKIVTITATAATFPAATASIAVTDSPWHNGANRYDVSGDDTVSAIDALDIINYINANGSGPIASGTPFGPPYYDVDDDARISAADVLAVINEINAGTGSEGEATAANNLAAPGSDNDVMSLLALDVAEQATRRRWF